MSMAIHTSLLRDGSMSIHISLLGMEAFPFTSSKHISNHEVCSHGGSDNMYKLYPSSRFLLHNSLFMVRVSHKHKWASASYAS
eukprot:c41792_g1_i1 orf=216-464(+)